MRRQGEPVVRDLIRMQVERQPKVGSENAEVQPWPIVAKVRPTPAPRSGVALRAQAAKTMVVPATPKSRKQIKRDNIRMLQARLDDLDSPVPHHQRHAVLDQEGHVISPPRVVSGSWRDPDDKSVRSRVPKLSHGFKPYDPILVLARSNPSVEMKHVVASDFYRLAHEKGPEAGISGGRDLVFSDRQFGTSQGPTDAKCDHMAQWRMVQEKFLPREQQVLQVVVLDRTAVSRWAASIGDNNTQKWVGYLICILDRLLDFYQDDVDNFLRQERVSLD
jgi:hypothetical protein